MKWNWEVAQNFPENQNSLSALAHGPSPSAWRMAPNLVYCPTLSAFLSREASVGGAGWEGAVGSVLKAAASEVPPQSSRVKGASSGSSCTLRRSRTRYSRPGRRETTCRETHPWGQPHDLLCITFCFPTRCQECESAGLRARSAYLVGSVRAAEYYAPIPFRRALVGPLGRRLGWRVVPHVDLSRFASRQQRGRARWTLCCDCKPRLPASARARRQWCMCQGAKLVVADRPIRCEQSSCLHGLQSDWEQRGKC